MGKVFILAGMMFGDEGKGSFVDYLANEYNITQIIRYNGGSQASHTVETPDGLMHKFSQLGSGMFVANCKTFLTSNMVINPHNLIEEIKVFSTKTGENAEDILDRICIDEDCYIVTPYHRSINRLRELSKGDGRTGSVGTGVSEVMRLLKTGEPLGIKLKDIYCKELFFTKLTALHDYLCTFYNENQAEIFRNIPTELYEGLSNEILFLTSRSSIEQIYNNYKQLTQKCRFTVCSSLSKKINFDAAMIFEPAQGLLLDSVYGLKPNTTQLDTTILNALKMVDENCPEGCDVVKVGIIKAFFSRHGAGVFPTEDIELSTFISDSNQEESFWNGKIRFGWFDAVLTRYAQSINNVDELYISSIDKLDQLPNIKICDSYFYDGSADEEFKLLFEYEKTGEGVFIHNIKNNDSRISGYLEKCRPVYIDMDGWLDSTSKARHKKELPGNCLKYIDMIERLTGIFVTLVSIGPTRNEKVVMP
jgi:adenylosuccinate synthase